MRILPYGADERLSLLDIRPFSTHHVAIVVRSWHRWHLNGLTLCRKRDVQEKYENQLCKAHWESSLWLNPYSVYHQDERLEAKGDYLLLYLEIHNSPYLFLS